jgi:C4-dicarboxylate transporter DctM subunit
MSPLILILILVILLFLFLGSGLEIAFALGLTGAIGLLLWTKDLNSLVAMGEIAWHVTTSYTLLAVPLFIFMGSILVESKASAGLYEAAAKLFSRLPGGLAVASEAACAIFAAVTGSSTACAAAIGMIAIPEMEKRGYNRNLIAGSICAGGTLGILIPPSIAFIIYGTIMETSIGQLYIAGVIPGIILASLFMLYVILLVKLRPSMAPFNEAKVSWNERLTALKRTIPILAILVLVLGGMFEGIFTPTEAAGIGASGSIVAAIVCRNMNFNVLRKSLLSSILTTSMIFMIIIGAQILSRIVALLDIPQTFTTFLLQGGLSRWIIFLLVSILYLIMGCLLDGVSMMVITLPVIGPMMVELGFDPVWFGVVMVVLIELGLITPPVGLNLYVVFGLIKQARFEELALSIVPFVFIMAILISFLVFFPSLALWLPGLMTKG